MFSFILLFRILFGIVILGGVKNVHKTQTVDSICFDLFIVGSSLFGTEHCHLLFFKPEFSIRPEGDF